MKTLRELVVDIPASKNPEADAFRYLTDKGDVNGVSWRQYRDDVYHFGAWLIEQGIGGNICIYGNDCYEWALAHVTIACGVGVAVGLDRDLPADEIIGQIMQCDSTVLLFTKAMAENLSKLSADMPKNVKIICIDDILKQVRDRADFDTYKYKKSVPGFDDVVSIFFTSGTTGDAKGIMIAQKNIVTCIIGAANRTGCMSTGVFLSVLPLHHSYACICGIYLPLIFGITNCFCSSIRRIVENIRIFKPQRIHIVPAIAEMLNKSLQSSNQTSEVFFGTKIECLISGGAALPQSIVDSLNSFGIPIYVGYGLTECCSAIIMQEMGKVKPGSIGKALDGCEVSIIDGEICARGDSLFIGYLKDKKATDSIVYDGWLHTGDIGYIDENGIVTITGRKKNLIILSNGKNVSPEELEQRLSAITEIREVIVYEENGLITAEIFPDSVSSDCEKIIGTKVHDLNKSLPVYKQIADIKFRQTEFEKTATKKIKRRKN